MKAFFRIASAILLGTTAAQAYAAGALNFPRVSFEEGSLTGVAIVNPTGRDAEVKLTVYGEDGRPLQAEGFTNPVTVTVPSNQQFAQVTSAIFGSGVSAETAAWLQATSQVDDLTGFFLFLNNEIDFFDGADLPPSARRIVFNEVRLTGGFSTEINLVNPTAFEASVDLRLVTGQGTATRRLNLPSRGVARFDAADFFDGAAPAGALEQPAYLIAESTVAIAGFEFVRGEGDLLGLNARPADEALNNLFFPQLAVLDLFQTELVVINYSDETVILTITAYQENGAPFDEERLRTNPVNRVLQAGQILRADVEELFGFFGDETLEGWLRVESNSQAVNGAISYSIPGLQSIAAVAGTPRGSTRAVFSHLATSLGFFTGVAVLNSGSLAANVRIAALRPDGTLLGLFTAILQPGQRISDLITEFVPEAADQAGGLIWISSDVPVFLTSLFGSLASGVLANIPAQQVPASYRPDQGNAQLRVSPPLAVLPPAGMQAFQAVGAVAEPVWSVNGVEGGNDQVGTITPEGLLSVPSSIPMPLPVVVTARADNQTAGASVDVVSRQVLAGGLGTVQSVAYLAGLQRVFTSELSAAGAEAAGKLPRQTGASSTIFDVTSGTRNAVATFAGEDVPKMVPFTGIDGREYLLLAGRATGRIIRLDPENGQSADVAVGLNEPRAIVIDPESGNLLVAEAGRVSAVSILELNQGLVSAARGGAARSVSRGRLFEGLSASGIAVDACSGDIYLSNGETGEIVAIDRETGQADSVAAGLSMPGQLAAFYRQGVSCPFFQLLAVERGAGQIRQVTPVLETAVPWAPSPGARDVAALPQGNPLGGNAGALLAEATADSGQVVQVENPLLNVGPTNPAPMRAREPEPPTPGVAYFPIVGEGREPQADATQVTTTVRLYNPSQATSSATIDFLDENGDPLTLEIDGQAQSSLDFEIQPGELVQAMTTNLEAPLSLGYARLTVQNGVLAEGVLRFEETPSGPGEGFFCELNLQASAPTTDLLSFSFTETPSGGEGGEDDGEIVLVVLNPETTETAAVTVRIFDGDTLAGTEELQFEPGQWSLFLSEDADLFPDVTIESGSGTVTVESDRPIVAAFLLFDTCPSGRVITP